MLAALFYDGGLLVTPSSRRPLGVAAIGEDPVNHLS